MIQGPFINNISLFLRQPFIILQLGPEILYFYDVK